MDKLIQFFNAKGIPLPMARDPKTGLGSITCTMVIVSFGICALGVLGKVARIMDGVDLTAAHSLLVISLSAYLGRKFQSDNKTATLDGVAKEKEENG